jgi:hypothetical protein
MQGYFIVASFTWKLEQDNPASQHTNQQRQQAIWSLSNLAQFQPVKAQMDTVAAKRPTKTTTKEYIGHNVPFLSRTEQISSSI